MPWENAKLQIADLDAHGTLVTITQPNADHNGASFQPEWDHQGSLWFINDDSGYGQLYRWRDDQLTLFPSDGAEMGDPLWVFGMKTYGFLADGRIIVRCLAKGKAWLSLIDPTDESRLSTPKILPVDLCGLEQLVTVRNQVAGILSSYDKPNAIASISTSSGETTIFKPSIHLQLASEQISVAKALSFQNELGQTVYGNYYPPTNSSILKLLGKASVPPVISHRPWRPHSLFRLRASNQKYSIWTSRGFGYFDINYSGGPGALAKPIEQRP